MGVLGSFPRIVPEPRADISGFEWFDSLRERKWIVQDFGHFCESIYF